MKARIKTSWGNQSYDLSIWDLVKVNDSGEVVLSNEFFNDVLSIYFLTNKEYKIINNKLSELKQELSKTDDVKTDLLKLKESLIKELTELKQLKNKKAEIVNKEIEIINNNFTKFKKESEQTLKELSEKYNQELHKKFLEELGKPISDKNKAVRETLTNIHNRICEGIDDYNKKDIFVKQFSEVVEKINLHLETKRNLLEWVTNGDFWKRDDERYKFDFSNFAIHNALRKLINDISAGCEPNELLVFINPQNKLVCKNVNSVIEKEQTTIKQKEAVESEDNEETENGDYV